MRGRSLVAAVMALALIVGVFVAGCSGGGDEAAKPEGDPIYNVAFSEAYEAEHGEYPSNHAASGYLEMQTIFDAIERAGSTDPEAIRDAMEDCDFESIIGLVKFDDYHRPGPTST